MGLCPAPVVSWMAVGRDKITKFADIAELIERFLDGQSSYPQEWNDFIEVSHKDRIIEVYRKRCYDLDPVVNCPGEPDSDAMAQLRAIVSELRLRSASG